MEKVFRRGTNRPAFVSQGYPLLINPKFFLKKDLVLSFTWEVKCLDLLPAFSLNIVKVRCGGRGSTVDVTEKFVLPERLEFDKTLPESKKNSAFKMVHYVLRPEYPEKIGYGHYGLDIEMRCLGEMFSITQNFRIVNEPA